MRHVRLKVRVRVRIRVRLRVRIRVKVRLFHKKEFKQRLSNNSGVND